MCFWRSCKGKRLWKRCRRRINLLRRRMRRLGDNKTQKKRNKRKKRKKKRNHVMIIKEDIMETISRKWRIISSGSMFSIMTTMKMMVPMTQTMTISTRPKEESNKEEWSAISHFANRLSKSMPMKMVTCKIPWRERHFRVREHPRKRASWCRVQVLITMALRSIWTTTTTTVTAMKKKD